MKSKWNHSHFYSRDVAEALAQNFIRKLAHLSDSEPSTSDVAAKRFEAQLPGGFTYFHFDVPRLEQPTLAERKLMANYGKDLTISTPELGYFSIHINICDKIESLTYIGKRAIPANNYLTMFNMFQNYYNRLVSRFEEGIIEDFVKYFEQPWALALFHDRLPDLLENLKIMSVNQATENIKQIMHSQEDPDDKYAKFDRSPERAEWDKQVYGFFRQTEVFQAFP